jgi:hypothetical protein
LNAETAPKYRVLRDRRRSLEASAAGCTEKAVRRQQQTIALLENVKSHFNETGDENKNKNNAS